MKTHYNNKNRTNRWYWLVAFLAFQACSVEGDNLKLDALPTPDFEIAAGENSNTMRLINTTNTPSIAYWTVPSTGQKLQGDTIELNFTFAGNYEVTLDVAAQGGMASLTKEVSIAQNDPTACEYTRTLGFLASCTSKTWRLNPAAGALKVGPGPDDGSWWSSGAGDVATRSCDFNDEYTFSFNANATFSYDSKGDFFNDGFISGDAVCEPESKLVGDQETWRSGTFSYTYIANAGTRGLGQIRLNGRGAHIGLRKAYNGGENASGPVNNAVTYDILEINRDVNGEGYDLLKLGVNIGGDGWWTFTLRSL
ncbi:hypothetical protein [Olivibacter sitiensis]|uniref:hypothetical protein n=1 Tax=Olivibacter sitiensis TaxID=376470 RepID=UPI0004241C01|nr:hypothetical protein [Olivibacter sitiensis]